MQWSGKMLFFSANVANIVVNSANRLGIIFSNLYLGRINHSSSEFKCDMMQSQEDKCLRSLMVKIITIEHSENKIIMQSWMFENEIRRGVIQSSV